ncbi:hypothetical protein I5Q34_04340 [Streptomyces sp. AV19]|nr:hypothetical protein [Streptomyces sp. AV19]MBH1933525.1 hypothetical protein [Streptomyces sp. AV19]MDG4532174.1 hypothetical protein [Streptomyces sp. AV19]
MREKVLATERPEEERPRPRPVGSPAGPAAVDVLADAERLRSLLPAD